MYEFMKKMTLLLICMPGALMTSLLSSSMIYIYKEYAHFTETIVTLIITIPTLTIMLGLVLAPILAKKFPMQHLILTGMTLFAITNVVLVWCKNFYLLLFFRALSGIGAGLVLPLQATLVALYPPKERATLMGFSAATGGIIAAALVSVSGIIAAVNWRYVFLLYLIAVLPIVLTVFFIPKTILHSTDTVKAVESPVSSKIPRLADFKEVLFLYYFLLIGSYLFAPILSSQLAPYLESVKLGGSSESGILMSIYLLGSVIAGVILERYMHVLKELAIPVIFAGTALGFALLWQATSIGTVGIAVFCIGFFSSSILTMVSYELSRALPLKLFTTASAGSNFVSFTLQFLAPILFLTVLDIVPTNSFRSVFMIYAIVQALFIIIALVFPKQLLKRKKYRSK